MKRLVLWGLSAVCASALFAQNEFTFNLYNSMSKNENLLFSPVSIKAAFAMAYEGANGQTQQEFEQVFRFSEDNTAFLKELQTLKQSAEICNSVWILSGYKILPSYTDKMTQLFDAPPSFTDFKHDPKGSADKINGWIEKRTKGMIQRMLSPDAVTEFKMALVNAVYFKQNWMKQFNAEITREKEFTNLDGSRAKVKMMLAHDHYRAFEGQHEKVIELPYADQRTSMVIVLPNQMKQYELTQDTYTNLVAHLTWRQVNLEFPQFTFETPTFELKELLQKMGMLEAFEDTADFSGMRTEKDLKIGTALHKAKIIVNESGTEAAAATVIGMVETDSVKSDPEPVMEFKTDKPFFYFIRDNVTGTILFIGKMNTMKAA